MKKGIRELFIEELEDMFSAEEQIVAALPGMVSAAESPDLKTAFSSHLKETKGQIQRLKKIFKFLKIERKEKFCTATKGLVLECKGVVKDFKKSALRDAALISKAQRIEHYKIAAYGTLRTFAKQLGFSEAASLLQATLDEEGNADKKLTKIAEGGFLSSGINQKADEPEVKKGKTARKPAAAPAKAAKTQAKKTSAAVPLKKAAGESAKKKLAVGQSKTPSHAAKSSSASAKKSTPASQKKAAAPVKKSAISGKASIATPKKPHVAPSTKKTLLSHVKKAPLANRKRAH